MICPFVSIGATNSIRFKQGAAKKYNPEASFFDDLSNDVARSRDSSMQDERKKNSETFDATSLQDNARRRPNNYRPGAPPPPQVPSALPGAALSGGFAPPSNTGFSGKGKGKGGKGNYYSGGKGGPSAGAGQNAQNTYRTSQPIPAGFAAPNGFQQRRTPRGGKGNVGPGRGGV